MCNLSFLDSLVYVFKAKQHLESAAFYATLYKETKKIDFLELSTEHADGVKRCSLLVKSLGERIKQTYPELTNEIQHHIETVEKYELDALCFSNINKHPGDKNE